MYNEETQDEIVAALAEIGMVQGRMIPNHDDEFSVPNALMSTVEDGPIWYGDIEYSDIGALTEIAKRFNRSFTFQSRTHLFKMLVVN
jgi:hypothetical protein